MIYKPSKPTKSVNAMDKITIAVLLFSLGFILFNLIRFFVK